MHHPKICSWHKDYVELKTLEEADAKMSFWPPFYFLKAGVNDALPTPRGKKHHHHQDRVMAERNLQTDLVKTTPTLFYFPIYLSYFTTIATLCST